MSKSALLALAVLASSAATARDFPEVPAPKGHTIQAFNNQARLTYAEHDLEGDKSNGFQVGARYQGAFLADLAFATVEADEAGVDGSLKDFALKVGYPITVYPMLQVTPYGVYGQHRLSFETDEDRANLRFRHAGLGVLTQMQMDSVVFGFDVSKSYMLSGTARFDEGLLGTPVSESFSLDKRGVTTLKFDADWNFTGNHHLVAGYSMFDWKLSPKDAHEAEKVEESLITVGYSISF